jgi:two-component system NtrC family response regulator
VLGGLITAAPEMVACARTIERVANTNVSVMLLGASGTGKELLAQGPARGERRKSGSFVAINCAAIPENLLESELFGHEKGAFTGAVKTTEGKIELADGGTLFLDEVGDIPLPLQVKLLRFLQERQIERIGGRKAIDVDTRIVCATHQDLEAMIADGRFREDLFYRLAEVVVKIPSLAERPGDAVLLAKAFLKRFAREMNPHVTGFRPDALAAIDAWSWPGNVRELENRVKRAAIMADGKLVSAATSTCSRAPRTIPTCSTSRRARAGRPQGHPPRAGAQRRQHLEHRAAARDQPADALRPAQALRPACLTDAGSCRRCRLDSAAARGQGAAMVVARIVGGFDPLVRLLALAIVLARSCR